MASRFAPCRTIHPGMAAGSIRCACAARPGRFLIVPRNRPRARASTGRTPRLPGPQLPGQRRAWRASSVASGTRPRFARQPARHSQRPRQQRRRRAPREGVPDRREMAEAGGHVAGCCQRPSQNCAAHHASPPASACSAAAGEQLVTSGPAAAQEPPWRQRDGQPERRQPGRVPVPTQGLMHGGVLGVQPPRRRPAPRRWFPGRPRPARPPAAHARRVRRQPRAAPRLRRAGPAP